MLSAAFSSGIAVKLLIGIARSGLVAYGCRCIGVDGRDKERGVDAREHGLEEGVLGRDDGKCPSGLERDSSCSKIFFAVLLVTPGRIVLREMGLTLMGFLSSLTVVLLLERC